MKYNLLKSNIPLIFADGTSTYKKLKKEHKTHKEGLFILAPSGAGKTYFVNKQKVKHWIDGDHLWLSTKAQPDGEWWTEDIETIFEVDQKCDLITSEAKKLGFWILGASNYWLKPDAVVIPDLRTQKKYIRMREEGDYDGGATSEDIKQILNHRKWIVKWVKKGVPKFKSIQEATDYFASKYNV